MEKFNIRLFGIYFFDKKVIILLKAINKHFPRILGSNYNFQSFGLF